MGEKADSSRQRRQRRAPINELSRNRILDAATESRPGADYEGTSIGAVSERQVRGCASSIYWHFKDKDDLIAAVIERSFANWLRSGSCPRTCWHGIG